MKYPIYSVNIMLCACAGKRSAFVLALISLWDKFVELWNKLVELYNNVTQLLWRLAEIHIHKLVMLAIFILCTLEVC